MRVLVDCVPILVGGGVQAAVAVLAGLRDRPNVVWKAVLPFAIKNGLPSDFCNDERLIYVNRRSQMDRIWLKFRLQKIEHDFAPDVVFTVFGPALFKARAPHLVGFARPHLIYDDDLRLRTGLIYQGVDYFQRRSFCEADHLVVETETARARLSRYLSIEPTRISVVGNCPNLLLQRLSNDADQSNSRFDILIPSTHFPHKNLEIIPKVASAMQQRAPGLDFEFRLTLPPDEAGWQGIKAAAEQLGVGHRVTTLGVVRITDLSRAYHDASAIFLPTLREVSTAVYPESFFFRRPLVTSNMDFAVELCGDAALFVDPLDPQSSADKLVALAADPELRRSLVDAGVRQLAKMYPTAEQKFDQQIQLIGSLACAQKSSAN